MSVPSRLRLSLLTGLLILNACLPTSDTPSGLTHVETWATLPLVPGQSDAAAVAQSDGGWIVAWAEAGSLRTRHVEASGADNPASATSPASTVTLGRQPWHLSLIPATGGWHLLWQDLDRFGEARLYSALLDLTGQLIRGPLLLAPDPVGDYAALAAHGAAIVVWTDTASYPTLFGHQIDAAGRPPARPPVAIARGTSQPMLARQNDGTWLLGWVARPFSPHAPDTLRSVKLLTSRQSLPWESADEPVVLGTLALENATSFVEHAALGLDQTHVYAFVTQRDAATQQAATTVLTAPLQSLIQTSRVERLALPDSLEVRQAALPTGFNTGAALAVPTSTTPASSLALDWLAPVGGQYDVLPAAANARGNLLVTYWQAGQWVGLQVIETSSVDSAALALVTDPGRHLSLLWTSRASGESEVPRLQLSTTQAITEAPAS